MTVTDANSDPISFVLDGNNALLNACCSGVYAGGTSAFVRCICSDFSLVNGGVGTSYIVWITANDGTFDSVPVNFSLTFTSLNMLPEFYDLATSFTVPTDTNPFYLNVQYRDLNLGDTLTFGYIFADILQAYTLISFTNVLPSLSPIYALGSQEMVFDFTDFVGTILLNLDVQDNNSAGGLLGNFSATK